MEMILPDPVAPEGWNLRSTQEKAINECVAAFRAGKKVVAIEGPTGSGKSLIGITIASMFQKSYYAVPLKALQDQIWEDFGSKETEEIAIFKGKSNYDCAIDEPDVPVSEAICQGWEGGGQRKECRDKKVCHYYNAMDAASKAKLTLLNFHLYLAWMRIAEKHPAPPIFKRNLHIIDEAHKVEETIRDHLMITFSEQKFREQFAMDFPHYINEETEEDEMLFFLKQVKIKNDLVLKIGLENYSCQDTDALRMKCAASMSLAKVYDFHLKIEDRLKLFLESPDNYAFGYEKRWHGKVKDSIGYITIKPLHVGGFIKQYVLGEFTLLMSATLPKQKVLQMGFTEDEIEYITMPSTFPKQNRPILFKNIGTMNMKTMDDLMPLIVKNTVTVMKKHQYVKGIIHAPSYRVAEILDQSIKHKFPEIGQRLLMQSRDLGGAMDVLRKHEQEEGPSVLLSPGMKEGIDLRDDLSRFQIILKCPYPSMSDPVVKKMVKDNYSWYVTETLITFFQMYGRSIRSDVDFAETYVFDNHLRMLCVRYKAFVPKYILEACKWVG